MKYANQKKIQKILLKLLQNEDFYKDLELIISKVIFTLHSYTSLFGSNPVLFKILLINYLMNYCITSFS